MDKNLTQKYSFIKISKNDYYEWTIMDMSKTEDCATVAKFLSTHYHNHPRRSYKYSQEYMQWALNRPNKLNISIAILEKKTKTMAGFINGNIIKTQIYHNTIDMVQCNFLCVHSKLQGRNVSKRLIKQLSNMFKINGYNSGYYTTDKIIKQDTNIYKAKYYHRPINVHNILDAGLLRVEKNMTTNSIIEGYELPTEPTKPRYLKDLTDTTELTDTTKPSHLIKRTNTTSEEYEFVQMKEQHLQEVYELLNSYLDRYNIYPIFNYDEFVYIFYNNSIVTSYVLVERGSQGLKEKEIVIDFISYYTLPTVIENKKNKTVNVAHLYYYTSTIESPYRLIRNMMIISQKNNIDEFIIKDIMENETTTLELGFLVGAEDIYYHLHNHKCINLMGKQIGINIVT
uniref:glycylpeptide N-tetradecanoyltransferase n=1 Tax=Mimivirus LCMiAC02 TaxID=2506609 RepID=A0A481Z1J1_9VIRU|nr:MAG: N-myristoyltransferase [Mimivirus LCMiAC02]